MEKKEKKCKIKFYKKYKKKTIKVKMKLGKEIYREIWLQLLSNLRMKVELNQFVLLMM